MEVWIGLRKMLPLSIFGGCKRLTSIFDYWGAPGQGRWKIYGLDLPGEILEKVYHKNAERIFGRFKGLAVKQGGGP
jgi:hypothetical protein